MKSHSVSHLILRAALAIPLLADSAFAQSGRAGRGIEPFTAEPFPDAGKIWLAVIVTALALFVTRGVYRKLP